MLYGGGRKLTSTAISNYTAAYQSLSCSPGVQETPVTTQEVSDIITKLYATAQAGTPVTLRVSRPHFHSTASFVCPIGRAGSLNASQPNVTGSTAAATEVGILQTKLNKVLAVDPVKSIMRVGSGMTIFELLKEATKNNMSLQVGAAAVRGAGAGGRWNLWSRAGGICGVSHLAWLLALTACVDSMNGQDSSYQTTGSMCMHALQACKAGWWVVEVDSLLS
jgi:FAD/FMN-containing dehydrogenase